MKEGEGFARLVTIANLDSFAPLLKTRRAVEGEGEAGSEEANEQSTDVANQNPGADPELAAAEALFGGKSIKTGVRFSRATHGASRPSRLRADRGPDLGKGTIADGEEVLLMRVRPRRDGTQLQISMIVHNSPFMHRATKVFSANDNLSRPIGYDHVNTAKKSAARTERRNTARFEAPELDGVANPVARFRWVDVDDAMGITHRILQYEIFDADESPTGRRLLQELEEGIATPPTTDLNGLSREETVLSKRDPEIAQWYRLSSTGL
jgi:hypothetical protein